MTTRRGEVLPTMEDLRDTQNIVAQDLSWQEARERASVGNVAVLQGLDERGVTIKLVEQSYDREKPIED